MCAMTPTAISVTSFFRGTDTSGRAASQWMLIASIFISWIFAKSVTNAANLGAAFVITVVMIVAGGSTVDSTFASLSNLVAQELPILRERRPGANAVRIGAWTMVVLAVIGNLPMIAGTDILKATTVSGTMVMGLAPVFLLAGFTRYSPPSFHLSFWTGIALGTLLTLGWIPKSWAIGDRKYALLLWTNLYGLCLCFAGFLLPLWRRRRAAVPI
jgi:hypothetical protein